MRKLKTILPLCLALVSVPGCRSLVLEDRGECPVFLFYDLVDRCELTDGETIVLSVWDAEGGSLLTKASAELGEIGTRDYWLSFHKTPEVVATGVLGLRGDYSGDVSTVSIPYGQEGLPLWRFSAPAEALSEEIVVPVVIRKDYSRVKVRFLYPDGAFPYSVYLDGNTSGIDLISGRPIEGPFHCEPRETASGEFEFVAPRQLDYSLALELLGKGVEDGERGHVDDIVLWDFLRKVEGFDWAADNLPDIDVEIDFVRCAVTVSVNGWTIAATISLTI